MRGILVQKSPPLRIRNDRVRHTTTCLMITAITVLVAYCSPNLPLLPGDVLVTEG